MAMATVVQQVAALGENEMWQPQVQRFRHYERHNRVRPLSTLTPRSSRHSFWLQTTVQTLLRSW
jgi:hypothetical protein